MDYLPISLRITGRTALVVGGGEVALRKAAWLARAGARLRVVAPVVGQGMRALLGEASHALRERAYAADDLRDAAVAVAASDDRAVNAQVSRDARAAAVPVNVVDAPALCTFVMPAVVDRDPLFIAVSSAGTSPVLARTTRAQLDVRLPARLGDLSRLLGDSRERVKARFATVGERRAFWERVLDSEVAELVFAGRRAEARQKLTEALAGAPLQSGSVFLVGVGPGDLDALTLAAHRALQRADLLLVAAEVPAVVVDHARRDAAREVLAEPLDVDALAQRLATAAQAGQRVCLLVAGDLGSRERTLSQRARALGATVLEVRGVACTAPETPATSR